MALRLAGLFLLLLPFVSLETLFGVVKGVELPVGPSQWLTGLLVVVLPSVLILWLVPRPVLQKCELFGQRFVASIEKTRLGFLLLLVALSTFLSSHFAFWHKPHLIDSIVQLFQAKIFTLGLLKVPTPKYPEFFMTQHTIFGADGWFGQYPPLHSLFLAVGELVSFSWLSQWVFSIATAYCLFRFSERVFGKQTAVVTLCVLLLSPFFILMSGSHMNHVPTLFFISLFLLLFSCWEDSYLARYALFAGMALGAAVLIRPLTALAFGAAFGCFALPTIVVRKDWRAALLGALGFAPLACLMLVYNKLTTGDAFTSGYVLLWGSSHELGFHRSPWGDLHTPLTGLRNELIDISLLNEFLFQAPIPSVMVLALYVVCMPRLVRWEGRLLIAFFAVPCCYFFYWHRDAFLGPRFLYETLPCLLVLTARALTHGLPILVNKTIGSDSFIRAVSLLHLSVLSFGIAILFTIGVGIPQQLVIVATSMQTMKRSIVAEAQAAGIREGLIFVKVPWGNRLLARMMGAGVSSSLAQRVYENADHCLLQEVLDRNNLSIEQRNAELEALIARGDTFLTKQQISAVSKDLSVHLRSGVALSPRCQDELRYDQLGASVYVSALLENSPRLQTPFIVATDMRERNALLKAEYPTLPAYIYTGKAFFPR